MADDLNLLHGTVTDGGGNRTFTDPGNANDGVDDSPAASGSFAAGAGTYTAYLETDLGSAMSIAEHNVRGDYECGTDATDPDEGWTIEASDDGTSWDTLSLTVSSSGVPGSPDYRVRFVLAAPESHRYWRLRARTTIVGLGFRCGSEVYTWEIFGETAPTEPPVDPGYTPPDAGHAILEIYVHDESASRWDVATWGDNDGIIEGTEGVWSAAGWEDVTPQGVTAHISWGSSRPERGILAEQEAQSWLVTTYDPDRILDPGNFDSPYYPQLVSGLPIRISNSVSGRTIRTGIVDRISYAYKAPDYRGQIQASSTIATAWRAEVPEDAILGDDLRTRIRDAVLASGIEIGGIPVLSNITDSFPDLPLSPRLEGSHNLWEHVLKAGQEVLWVVYEDAAGTLRSRPWGGPLDRGSEITYANLEDLTSESSEDGVYSVVFVQPADPDAPMIERVAAPLPRYGRRAYTRSETTIDPDAWADALLADRSWPGVTWTPGTVWCFDAADVEFMSSLEIMERVRILVPGSVDVTGKLLGMELWVSSQSDTKSRWLFLPRIATDGSSALDTDLLVSDGGGDTLLADDGSGDYLEAD